MMSRFLANNRDELVKRCAEKVALRPKREATTAQLKNGIPMFLEQLQRTLEAEEEGDAQQSKDISGKSGGDAALLSEMGVSATAHGKMLLELGFTVDQVVHDYGDLCQAITDLAYERDAPFGIDEFRTLNRCLDNAIADAVTEFSYQRDESIAKKTDTEATQKLGFLIHELRNSLGTAMLAVAAMRAGTLTIQGATGAVLDRSLLSLKTMLDEAEADVRKRSGSHQDAHVFAVAPFIAEAKSAAALYADASGCTLTVAPVDPKLTVYGNRERLMGALANLLQNGMKFTQRHTDVRLSVTAREGDVLIEVSDHCGGLPPGGADLIFSPFKQRSTDRSGLGLGLSIARQSVERVAAP
jgi:signal transduction histidine kinase